MAGTGRGILARMGTVISLMGMAAGPCAGPAEPIGGRPEEAYVTFVVRDETFALPVGVVREVVRVGRWTAVPGAPSDVVGILTVRNRLVPLLDLGERWGLGRTPIDRRTRALLCGRAHPRAAAVALLAASVEGVVSVPAAAIEPKGSNGCEPGIVPVAAFARLGERTARILDADAVLDSLSDRADGGRP